MKIIFKVVGSFRNWTRSRSKYKRIVSDDEDTNYIGLDFDNNSVAIYHKFTGVQEEDCIAILAHNEIFDLSVSVLVNLVIIKVKKFVRKITSLILR